MPADIFFTHHAVERFIERHAPELDRAGAQAHLQSAAASRLKERTILGQLQFQLEEPRCVLVVKRDFNHRPELVCVTVLPERENSRGWSEDEQEIANEWLADQAAARVMRDLSRPEAVAKAPSAPLAPKPKAQAPMCLPRDPEQARIVAELTAKQLDTKLAVEREKTKRHEITERGNLVLLKRVLRIVLTDLVERSATGDETALAIAELVQQVRPEFLMEEFLRIEQEEKEGTA